MATIRLKFRPSSVPEAEGTLYYQVIHKRKVKWISTEHHIYGRNRQTLWGGCTDANPKLLLNDT